MNAHAHEHTRAHTRMHTHVQLLSEGEQRCAEMAALKDELETVQQRLDDASGPSKTPLPIPKTTIALDIATLVAPTKQVLVLVQTLLPSSRWQMTRRAPKDLVPLK